MIRFPPKLQSLDLLSLEDYVFAGSPDARGWSRAGQAGLITNAIPGWIKACRRRYAEERSQDALIDTGGES